MVLDATFLFMKTAMEESNRNLLIVITTTTAVEKEVLTDATFCKKQNLCFVQLKLIICYPPWLILLHFICNFLFFIILMKSEGLYHFLKSCNTGRIKRKSIRADMSFYVKNYFMISEIVLLVCKNKLRLFSPACCS